MENAGAADLKNHLSEKPPAFLRAAFPQTLYYPDFKLVTWHPRGVLSDAFADQVVEFIECQERIQEAPFDRFTDFSGLSDIRLKVDHFFEIGQRRQRARQQAKSAFFAEKPVGFFIAQMYETIMEEAMIEVRAFSDRKAAAEWLGVPWRVLQQS